MFAIRINRNNPVVEPQFDAPGVAGAGRLPGKLNISPDQNPQGGQPININGQHFSGTAFQFDGTETRDPLEGIVVINPTLDSVGEMKITTQGYNAEFGEATAGVVTVQSRTGGNGWHGDGFGFRRTGFGQADDPFSPGGVPPTKYIIFGGSVGGPIIKNKLFLFGDYQGTRSSLGTNRLLSVPSQNVLTSCVGPNGDIVAHPTCDLSDYRQRFIQGTLTNSDGTVKFVNDQVPNSGTGFDDHVSSQAASLLALLPPPNFLPTDSTCAVANLADSVCNNFLASGQEVFNGDQFDIRSDYNLNSRFRLFGRYSFGGFYDNGAPAFGPDAGGIGTNPSGFAGIARTRNQGVSSGFTYTIGPKVLTDFRFGYFRYRLNVNAQDFGQIPAIEDPNSKAEIPNISAASTGDPFATGLPDFEIPALPSFSGDYLRFGYSVTANSCNCPLREREQQFQFANNWTWNMGKHIFKWGADLRFLQNYRLSSDQPTTGTYAFGAGTTGRLAGETGATGLGLATFLIGDVSNGFSRTVNTPQTVSAGERQRRFGFYGQDTWRVNSRLTLNYGLRWEIYFPQTVTNGGGFLLPNLTNPDAATTFISGASSSGGVSGNLTNFAPRLGFAYLINPTTVVRAGYARSFDAGYAGDLFGIAPTDNPPVSVLQNVSGLFNLAVGPPVFQFPDSSRFSLLSLAELNIGAPAIPPVPAIPASGAVLYALAPRVRVPTVDSWNVTIQHEFTSHLYFELAYVGNKGTNVFTDSNSGGTYYDLNQPSLKNLIGIPENNPVNNKPGVNCKGGANGIFPGNHCFIIPQLRTFFQDVSDPCLPRVKPCEFDPTLFPIEYFGNNANNNYNSLQAKVSKNFNHGYSVLAHYTWSKGFDYDRDYFGSNPEPGYGPANFDIRHRFVMTNIWELPVGRGKAWLGGIGPAANRFIGGWTISAITIWQSGFPFSPTYLQGSCTDDTDAGEIGHKCRPNRVGEVVITGNRNQYFTTTGGKALPPSSVCTANGNFCGVDAQGNSLLGGTIGPWQRPAPGQVGNAGRNSLTGPGFFQSDVGLSKVILITERTDLRFRAEGFNVFNVVNLGQPNTCVDCPSGSGAITSHASGAIQRTLQFSLRFEF